MREIKFRCWNTSSKAMYPNEHFGISMDGDILQLMPRCEHYDIPFVVNNGAAMIFMQYTGLLDKNGKPIYEGDILAVSDKPLYKVEWSNHMAMFDLKKANGDSAVDSFDACEVIGNIHENKDLLKEEF